jgi:serine/threonine protein kinase
MDSSEVQSSQQSKAEAAAASVEMSQASQPAANGEPSVEVSQPTIGGVIGKRSLHTGTKVGDFEIQTLIAAGAFAEVYEAKHPVLGSAAVKIGPLVERRRFEREWGALKSVGHPNLIQFHAGGTFEKDGREHFWLAMEYPGPTTLATLIERKELDSSSAMECFGQLLDALVALHAAGLAHRDLKPRNILVNGGRLKLIDFGLTKTARSGDDSLTITGQLVGTPRYMSPEQVRGITEVGPAADLWAAGVILYEMLTFRVPGTLRKWLIELLNRDDPRARGSALEARAVFGTLASPLIVRLKDVKRRSAWRKVDEARLLSAFLAGEAPGASPIDVARRFVLFAETKGVTGLQVEDVVQVISTPANSPDTLQQLSPTPPTELSFQSAPSTELLRQAEQLRVRAKALWIACAIAGIPGGILLSFVVETAKKGGGGKDVALFAFLGMLGIIAAVLFGGFAHSADEERRRLLPIRKSVLMPTWENCPGQFSVIKIGTSWEQRQPIVGFKSEMQNASGLAFEASPLFGDSDMLEIANAGRILALRLSRCRKLTEYGFAVIPTLRDLDALWLDDTRISIQSLREICVLKNLRQLDLAVCRELPGVALDLVAAMNALTSIDLSFNNWINAISLQPLCRLENLVSLAVAGCDGVDGAALEVIARIPNLRFLNLRWCRAVRDDGLAALKQATRLTTLDLRGNPHITDWGLLQLAELKYLTNLQVADCPNVRNSGLAELRRALPMCRVDTEGVVELPRLLYGERGPRSG